MAVHVGEVVTEATVEPEIQRSADNAAQAPASEPMPINGGRLGSMNHSARTAAEGYDD